MKKIIIIFSTVFVALGAAFAIFKIVQNKNVEDIVDDTF